MSFKFVSFAIVVNRPVFGSRAVFSLIFSGMWVFLKICLKILLRILVKIWFLVSFVIVVNCLVFSMDRSNSFNIVVHFYIYFVIVNENRFNMEFFHNWELIPRVWEFSSNSIVSSGFKPSSNLAVKTQKYWATIS